MEFPAYDPRGVQGMGLGYATSNRGGCHLRGYTLASEVLGIPTKTDPCSTEGKAALSRAFQDINAAFDATGTCIFLTFGIDLGDELPELVAATGIDYTMESLMEVGERIFNLERLWLFRAGFSGADDTLPQRLLRSPIPHGPMKGQVCRLEEMLPHYYEQRGWDQTGRPGPERLGALGLDMLQ
jgi:aldehyde:ferredoxin oxidoreductase